MSSDMKAIYDIARYRSLGLIANPFFASANGKNLDAVELDVVAVAHGLLGTIIEASAQSSARPIVVTKSSKIPLSYPLRSIGLVERSLAIDDGVDVLHAYVQLYMMRLGRVRSILAILAERLVFHGFDKTLELYVERVLAEPDDGLVSYQVLGAEGLAAFAERFRANPGETTRGVFGDPTVERHPELSELADTRVADLEVDVENEDAEPEIDSSVGDSAANAMLIAASRDDEAEIENNDQIVVDYIIEYTKVHYSPVLARGLRVYLQRGLAAMITELKVTKAPKKTLAALARFARIRFKKVALIFDGFEDWLQVPSDLRSLIVGNLSEVRWSLDHDAVMIFLLDEDGVPELDEAFGGGTRVVWDYARVPGLQLNRAAIDTDAIDFWLASAAIPGTTPMTMADPVLAGLAATAEGFREFAFRAATAIEDAAERAVPSLDESAHQAGVGAEFVEADWA